MSTNSSTFVRRGDIYLVDFKNNQGAEQNGLRPALILQNDIGNRYSPTTVVCPITSSRKKFDRTHVKLLPEESGILRESVILCEQLRVIDKSRLHRKVGHLFCPLKMEEVEEKTKIVLNLAQFVG